MISIERIVAFVLGPIILAGSAWLAGAAGKYGLHLDKTGIAALATSGAVGAVGLVWKWLHGRQKQLGPVFSEVKSLEGTVAKYDPGLLSELKTFVGSEIAKVASLIPQAPATTVHPAAPSSAPDAAAAAAAAGTGTPASSV